MDIPSSKTKWHGGKLLNQAGPNADCQPLADLSPYSIIRSTYLPPVRKVMNHIVVTKLDFMHFLVFPVC